MITLRLLSISKYLKPIWVKGRKENKEKISKSLQKDKQKKAKQIKQNKTKQQEQ